MKIELKKRIKTSIILLLILSLIISLNQIIFGIGLFIISMHCFNEWCVMNIKYFGKNKTNYLLIQFSGIIYMLIFFTSSILLRGNSNESLIFLIITLLICFCSDIGGFVTGKIVGGKKLTKISPNKTISGSIGSFAFSLLPLIILNLQKPNSEFLFQNILYCLLISLFCQIGDLLISFFKRLNRIKDTGNILPGHGGFLDRVDGIIFAIPVSLILKFSNMI